MSALSAKELNVLKRIVAGDDIKNCARSLGISPETVKDYRRLILLKLGAKNMPHAVAIAFKQGIVS